MLYLRIFYTTDLVEDFERELGFRITPEDQFKIFDQLFQILDKHNPLDLPNMTVLSFDELIFANHLTLDTAEVNRMAYRLLLRLWERVQEQQLYIFGELMFFPYSMSGKDVCVRRYNS